MADPMYNNGGVIFFLCLSSLLAIAGLGCAIGGAGALHSDCNSGPFDESCADLFRPIWWSISFESVVLVLAYGLVSWGLLGQVRLVLVAFVAMATIEVMDELEKVLQLKDRAFYKAIRSREEEIDVTMAGLILLSIVNFILITILGLTAGRTQSSLPPGRPAAQPKSEATPPAPQQQQQQVPAAGGPMV